MGGDVSIELGGGPPGSRIRLVRREGRRAIILPRALLRGRVWAVLAFGVPFLAIPAITDGGLKNFLVGFPLTLIGVAVVTFGLFLATVRQVIVDDGRALVVETELFGRVLRYDSLLKRDVVTVALGAIGRSVESPPRAVWIDASAGRRLCLGACLSGEELDWLRRSVGCWVES